MNKIIVKQTHIEINNYEFGDSPKIEHTFSIYDRTYHASFVKGIIYREDIKTLYLPRGIDITWLENIFFEQAYYDYSYDDYDDMTNPLMLKYLPRDDIQKKAIAFMIGEREYEVNKAYPSLSINLNTGKGKTYCTVAAMAYFSIKSIIITSSINWLNQWKNFILEYTDLNPDQIIFISGTPMINRLLKNKKMVDNTNIYLVSHNTIKSYGDNFGWDKVAELFRYLKIGVKAYDEAHLNFDNMCAIDYHTNTFKTYYVTATPLRSDEEENKIYQLYMKNIPHIDLFDEENDPRTKYIAIRYNSHPTPIEASNCKNQYGLDRNKYTNYVVYKENFQNMMHILMDKIRNANGKVLVYIGTNAAIEVVKDWIITNYPRYADDVGVYTSLVTENKEEQLSKKIILSTTKSCGAAMDIKGLKMTILLAEPFKSKVLARQTLGRTRDNNTVYIEIVDEGFYYTKKYYLSKEDVFSKYATSCTEIKLNDNILYEKANELYGRYQCIIDPFIILDGDYSITPFIICDKNQLIEPFIVNKTNRDV